MTDELVFETPPEGHGNSKWMLRLLAMSEHPGEWVNATKTYGLSPKSGGAMVTYIRKAADRAGLTIEARAARQGYPDAGVYVRVVKEES
jgi:hypothetical protein